MSASQSASVTTAVHYANLSRSTAFPALQSKYLEKLHHHSKDRQLPVPFSPTRSCTKCHVLLVPGYNLSVRVKFKKSVGKERHRERFLRYSCLLCGFHNDHHDVLHQKRPVVVPKQEVKKEEFKLEWTPGAEKRKSEAPKDSKLKKRSQKRKKMNDLSLLLNNKNKSESKISLNLMDFMK